MKENCDQFPCEEDISQHEEILNKLHDYLFSVLHLPTARNVEGYSN